ncbi:hypothetical protein Tco_1378191 [Tanacetum coccineum]
MPRSLRHRDVRSSSFSQYLKTGSIGVYMDYDRLYWPEWVPGVACQPQKLSPPTPRYSALGLRGRLRGDKKDGGSRGVGASSSAGTKSSDTRLGMYTLGHDPPVQWDQVITLGARRCVQELLQPYSTHKIPRCMDNATDADIYKLNLRRSKECMGCRKIDMGLCGGVLDAMHVWCKTWSKRQSKVQVMGLGLRCGYFFLNGSSRSHGSQDLLLGVPSDFDNGIRLSLHV